MELVGFLPTCTELRNKWLITECKLRLIYFDHNVVLFFSVLVISIFNNDIGRQSISALYAFSCRRNVDVITKSIFINKKKKSGTIKHKQEC